MNIIHYQNNVLVTYEYSSANFDRIIWTRLYGGSINNEEN